MVSMAEAHGVGFLFVGGSLITGAAFDQTVQQIKQATSLPLILFPGSPMQLTASVDAVLFLSLISGRNPELLIGHHVLAAPRIKELGLETIATGYMLIDCGKPTTASYISNTTPIPHNKPEIAATTAMAGEMLGLQCLYLDGGSGAFQPVSSAMIQQVRAAVELPLIVGGGIRSSIDVRQAFDAGADIVVIGTAIEQNPELIAELDLQVLND
jgi:putative glycerol-1-phosphate prenyltransferase